MFFRRNPSDFVIWLERVLWASLVFALGSGGIAASLYLALESGRSVYLYDVSLISLRIAVVIILAQGALLIH
jgi:hypothetical protein